MTSRPLLRAVVVSYVDVFRIIVGEMGLFRAMIMAIPAICVWSAAILTVILVDPEDLRDTLNELNDEVSG